MAASHNDGTIPYGSRTETIGGTAYVLDDIEITRPVAAILRMNQLGEPSGSVGVAKHVTGSATAQIATAGTLPVAGQSFSDTFVTSVGSETFKVTTVSQPEGSETDKKARIEFIKMYN
jgi:hypothetical protein